MIIYKTSSTEAPASTVPLAIRPDSTSPFWARSDPCLALEKTFSELFSSARKGRQEMRKSVFSQLDHSRTIVARARAVRMSLGATPEAQGARHSGRTEGTRRGLSARRNPRRGKRVNGVLAPHCLIPMP